SHFPHTGDDGRARAPSSIWRPRRQVCNDSSAAPCGGPMTTPTFAPDVLSGGGDLLLGVEGSGVKTQAVIADRRGSVIGRGLAGSSNQHRVGLDKAFDALAIAIDAATAQAPPLPSSAATSAWGPRIAAACLGLSGVDQPQDQTIFADWLR